MEFIYDSIDELYVSLGESIMENGNTVFTRNNEVKELLSVSITLKNSSNDNFLRNKDRKLSLRYAFGELLWYLSGSDSLDFISHYSSSYSRFSDDKKTLNGAYGPRIMPYIESIVNLLKEDIYTRRAVINIYNNTDIGLDSMDIPCTMSLHFIIRNNKLILQTYMRSNDLYLGFPYDIFSFTFLQKFVANKLNIEVGSYHHYVSSLHIYKRNYNFFSNITKDIDISVDEKIPDLDEIIQNLEIAKNLEKKLRFNEESLTENKNFITEMGKLVNILRVGE